MIERGQPTIQLFLLGVTLRKALVLQAVPELTDQVEPLVDREPADLVAGELHTASLARQCRSDNAHYGN